MRGIPSYEGRTFDQDDLVHAHELDPNVQPHPGEPRSRTTHYLYGAHKWNASGTYLIDCLGECSHDAVVSQGIGGSVLMGSSDAIEPAIERLVHWARSCVP